MKTPTRLLTRYAPLFSTKTLAGLLDLPLNTLYTYVRNWGVGAPWPTVVSQGKKGNCVRFWDTRGALEWARFIEAYPCVTSGAYAPQTPTNIPCNALTTINHLGELADLPTNTMYGMAKANELPTPTVEDVKGDGRAYRYYAPDAIGVIINMVRQAMNSSK